MQQVLPLVTAHDSDADEVAADGPGRGSDPIDAWPGDVHRQAGIAYRVRTCRRVHSLDDYALAVAREHGPFGVLRAGIMVRVEGGGQRHVQQDGHFVSAPCGSSCAAVGEAMSPSIRTISTVSDGGNDAG